jgi:hypothetical protein
MKRYLQGGSEQITKDIATILPILHERKGSWQSLDGMKRRLNVFQQFAPSPAPSPTPSPADGPEEEAGAEDSL